MAGSFAMTNSTSASVFSRPSVKRNTPSASIGLNPIAVSTWLGVGAPLAHAEPEEAATPCQIQGDQQRLGFHPPDHKADVARQPLCRMPGQLGVGDARQEAANSRSRSAVKRTVSASRSAWASSRARAMPAM